MLLVHGKRPYVGRSIGPTFWRASKYLWGGPGASWLNTPLPDNAAIHTNSAAAATRLSAVMSAQGGWLNAEDYTSEPYVTYRNTPLVKVIGGPGTPLAANPDLLAKMVAVPLPPGARPSSDSSGVYPDSTLAFWDPWRDLYVETWVTVPPDESASGFWEAAWGGVMENASQNTTGHFRELGSNEHSYWGSTATSIPMLGTGITVADCRRWNPRTNAFGNIDHPVGLLTPAATTPQAHVWPAQRHDGASGDGLPHGARGRLPHNHVIQATHPFAIMIEDCLQTYGYVHQDTTNTSLIIRCEPGVQDYWNSVYPNSIMAQVPWGSTVRLADGNDSVHTPLS